MNLFSTLMTISRRSGRRRDGTGESIPWDADAFPYHTVKRSIDLASMVPGQECGGWQLATSGRRSSKRSQRMRRRAAMFLCAVGGLGLVLLSLTRTGKRHLLRSPEGERRNPSAGGPNRNAPRGQLRRSSDLSDNGNTAYFDARIFNGSTHDEPTAHERQFRRPAASRRPVEA